MGAAGLLFGDGDHSTDRTFIETIIANFALWRPKAKPGEHILNHTKEHHWSPFVELKLSYQQRESILHDIQHPQLQLI